MPSRENVRRGRGGGGAGAGAHYLEGNSKHAGATKVSCNAIDWTPPPPHPFDWQGVCIGSPLQLIKTHIIRGSNVMHWTL